MRFLMRTVGVLILATAAVLAPAALAAEQRRIDIVGVESPFYRPPDRNINAGDSVVWRNSADQVHTATGPGCDTGRLQPGQTSKPCTFNQPGVFEYRCSIHSHMRGRIEVNPAPEPDPTISPPSSPAAPQQPTTSPRPSPAEVSETPEATPSPAPESPTPSPTPTEETATDTAAAEAGDSGVPVAAAIGGGIVLLAAAAGALWWFLRRRAA